LNGLRESFEIEKEWTPNDDEIFTCTRCKVFSTTDGLDMEVHQLVSCNLNEEMNEVVEKQVEEIEVT
jgi:hypothetical protein